MTTITTTGTMAGLQTLSSSDYDVAFNNAFDYFAANFEQVVYDALVGNGSAYAATNNYLYAYLYGADGEAEFYGSGFYGYSGQITQINFLGDDGGAFSVRGNARWSAYTGAVTGSITSIAAAYGDDAMLLEGRFTIDVAGYLTGTVNHRIIQFGDYTSEMFCNVSLATGAGTITKIILDDGHGNTLTANGNYTAALYDSVVLNAANTGEVLDSPALFNGNDVFTVADASRAWHGFDGNDLITGGIGDDDFSGDSGTDTLRGLTGSDLLDGGDGNDTLDGGGADDLMIGGTGNDLFIVDSSTDFVSENAGGGIDTVSASASFDLGSNAIEVEALILTGTGNIDGTGNALNNTLTGNNGSNRLDGGTGADKLIGGAGNDIYVVDTVSDVISDSAGLDTVEASGTYTLGTNLEFLLLTGSGNIDGTGNTLNNILTGNDGNNTLNGLKGADTMIGGLGDDTYVVDSLTDLISEASGAGTETVISTVTYTLGQNLENLTLTGTSGISGTGNDGDNMLTGNSGANTLDGGAGADQLVGGAGKDTYVIDNAGDTITENGASTEIDTVISYLDYTLGLSLECLTLRGTAILATGNSTGNTLVGNDMDNTLDGGLGLDKMTGGNGNDVYFVDNVKDTVTEASSGGGHDTVYSSADFTLGTNVEDLHLSGSAVKGVGNSGINMLTGNDSANSLSGMLGNDILDGGNGADTLIGGTGADIFVFSSTDGISDTITDFSRTAGDKIDISAILTGYDSLHASDFISIISSGTNSVLMIDRDGAGSAFAWEQAATLTRVISLPSVDVLISEGSVVVI
ncbi:MAG TPA: calcium-binding protein [Patescibacteria group bacterium]|nr:calcium-binding protein [Patescibacteria group bacterium]